MKTYSQRIVTLGPIGVGYNAEPINDEADWFYIDSMDQEFLQVKLDQGGPFLVAERHLIQQSFQQMIVGNPVNGTGNNITAVRIVYGVGVPPILPPKADLLFDYEELNDLVLAAGATTLWFSPYLGRSEADLCIPNGQPGGLRIGGSTTGPAKGLFLPVGVPWRVILPASGLYINNPNAAAVTLTGCMRLMS